MKKTKRLEVHDHDIFLYLVYRSGIKYKNAHWKTFDNRGYIDFEL